jgi:hypothetical protein
MKRGLVWALGVLFAVATAAASFGGEYPNDGKEVIDITKAIYIGVKQLKQVEQSAEASATKEDWSFGNVVYEVPEIIEGNDVLEEPDTINPILPIALIHDGVFNEFSGIITLNQSPGDINNQGNAVSTAFTQCGETFLHAHAQAEKILGSKFCLSLPWEDLDGDGDKDWCIGEGNSVEASFTPRSNLITQCLIGVHGIVAINQSTGNINNQNNAVAMAVSDGAVACLAESDLDLVSGNNYVKEIAVVKNDTLEGGIFSNSGSSGMVAINQATGNICNQANVISSCLVAEF